MATIEENVVVKRDIYKYGFLFFAYQALNTAQKVLRLRENRLWHNEPTFEEVEVVKDWVKRLYTSCILHKNRKDQASIDYRMDLMYDIDEYLNIHHSLRGHSCISAIDVLFFSLFRREMKIIKNIKPGSLPSILNFTHQLQC